MRIIPRSIHPFYPLNKVAFFDTVALPASVFGPVDFSHSRHCRISSAWRARLSGVQPFAIFLLQEFVFPIRILSRARDTIGRSRCVVHLLWPVAPPKPISLRGFLRKIVKNGI